jgi:hypothetical protein
MVTENSGGMMNAMPSLYGRSKYKLKKELGKPFIVFQFQELKPSTFDTGFKLCERFQVAAAHHG